MTNFVVETCNCVNHTECNNLSCWWERSDSQNQVPNSDISVTCNHISWTGARKLFRIDAILTSQ